FDTPADIRSALAALAIDRTAGLIAMPDTSTTTHSELIAQLAASNRIPAVYPYSFFVSAGGLLSYGTDFSDLYRRAASYVDRILRGERASELPVQAPTKYTLVINLKAAKALDLEMPPTLLALADEVIE